MSKAVTLLLLLQVLAICSAFQFMIKNKKSGMVLDGQNQKVTMGPYEEKRSQLWTSKPGRGEGLLIINVANGKALDVCPTTLQILTWTEHGNNNQQWKITDDDRIKVEHFPLREMVHRNNGLFMDFSQRTDKADEWLLIEP